MDEKPGEPVIGDAGADAQINLARGTVVTNAKAELMSEDAFYFVLLRRFILCFWDSRIGQEHQAVPAKKLR